MRPQRFISGIIRPDIIRGWFRRNPQESFLNFT
jgi:hypothetical protein